MENKKLLTDEILSLRKELKEKNEMINNLGSSVSFVHVFVIPLIVAAITTFIVSKLSLSSNQSVGFFIVVFIISISLATIKNKKELAKRKEELIEERLTIQKALVEKGKELSKLENDIEN